MAIINKQDTNGTKPLLGKGELGYDDYAIGGDTGRVYVGTGTENIALAERLESNMMTKAQFNALAEEIKANRGGSGFDEFGAGNSEASKLNINYGMHVWSGAQAKYISLGRETDFQGGISKTLYAKLNINGVNIKLGGVAHEGIVVNNNRLDIILPTAPNIYPHDTVLTAEQIASGVIKHADASNSGLIINGKFDVDTSGWTLLNGASFSSNSLSFTTTTSSAQQVNNNMTIGKQYVVEFNVSSYTSGTQIWVKVGGSAYSVIPVTRTGRFQTTITATNSSETVFIYSGGYFIGSIDNIAVYPADAISRSDLVFLESWHEDISEKNFVYPLGNVQYLGSNTDGLTGIANGAFTGFETYSLFGNWQTPSALIGKGYVWSSLTEAQRKAFIANPDNNCYLDGDKVIQVRYRVRVLMGEDTNSMAKATVQGKAVVPSIVLFTSPTTTVDAGLYSNTSTTYTYTGTTTGAISISTVSRRNQGLYHPVYNANGSKKASDDNFWYNTAVSFTSISDCFNPAKLLTNSGSIASGVSGRPD